MKKMPLISSSVRSSQVISFTWRQNVLFFFSFSKERSKKSYFWITKVVFFSQVWKFKLYFQTYSICLNFIHFNYCFPRLNFPTRGKQLQKVFRAGTLSHGTVFPEVECIERSSVWMQIIFSRKCDSFSPYLVNTFVTWIQDAFMVLVTMEVRRVPVL